MTSQSLFGEVQDGASMKPLSQCTSCILQDTSLNVSFNFWSTIVIQKDSILERKFCIEHVIFWWKTQSCAETMRPRPHVNGYNSSLSLYFIENWYNSAVVAVKYDPMFLTHVMLCSAASEKMIPPPPLGRKSIKELAHARQGVLRKLTLPSDTFFFKFWWQSYIFRHNYQSNVMIWSS